MTANAWEIEPEAEKDTDCGHATPQFGCFGCIQADKKAWAATTFAAWKKTYKPPKCAECGSKMFVYDHYQGFGKLMAVVSCTSVNGDGPLECPDLEIPIA